MNIAHGPYGKLISRFQHNAVWGHPDTGINVLCADGKRRTIQLTAQADTFFSWPGRTSMGGKTVRGFVTSFQHTGGAGDLMFVRNGSDDLDTIQQMIDARERKIGGMIMARKRRGLSPMQKRQAALRELARISKRQYPRLTPAKVTELICHLDVSAQRTARRHLREARTAEARSRLRRAQGRTFYNPKNPPMSQAEAMAIQHILKRHGY